MKNKHQGFTLIELLITIAIAAILLMSAGSFFGDIIRSNRIQTGTHQLYTALVTARSEAVKRNQDVTITQKTGGWNAGWTIADLADSDTVQDQVLSIKNLTITGSSPIVFKPDGSITAAVTFTVCGDDSTPGRTIALSATGRPHSAKNVTCPSS